MNLAVFERCSSFETDTEGRENATANALSELSSPFFFFFFQRQDIVSVILAVKSLCVALCRQIPVDRRSKKAEAPPSPSVRVTQATTTGAVMSKTSDERVEELEKETVELKQQVGDLQLYRKTDERNNAHSLLLGKRFGGNPRSERIAADTDGDLFPDTAGGEIPTKRIPQYVGLRAIVDAGQSLLESSHSVPRPLQPR
ncbi:hypothetical protein CPC08DRAFT_720701 [Agrocybe pediades]|nr:hypothetical protein CPC08DRAFT_720701 [Agrocybe pediades]